MVAVPLAVPLMVTGVVDPNEQVISAVVTVGAQVSATAPVNPVPGVTVTVDGPAPPGAEIITEVPETVNPAAIVSVMVAEVDAA